MSRLDRMDKRLLACLHQALDVDVDQLAAAAGCTPAVARERLQRLRDEEVVTGFRACIGPTHLPPHELLVVGVPTEETTDEAIAGVCADAFVSRFFTLAAHTSVAFVVRGSDLPALRKHAARLAADAGLRDHQGILVVKTFHENHDAGAPWTQVALTA